MKKPWTKPTIVEFDFHDKEDIMDSTDDKRIENNTFRHQYRILTDEEKEQMLAIKDMALALHELYASIGESRTLSIAKTRLEESVMWAVKHITE